MNAIPGSGCLQRCAVRFQSAIKLLNMASSIPSSLLPTSIQLHLVPICYDGTYTF